MKDLTFACRSLAVATVAAALFVIGPAPSAQAATTYTVYGSTLENCRGQLAGAVRALRSQGIAARITTNCYRHGGANAYIGRYTIP